MHPYKCVNIQKDNYTIDKIKSIIILLRMSTSIIRRNVSIIWKISLYQTPFRFIIELTDRTHSVIGSTPIKHQILYAQ